MRFRPEGKRPVERRIAAPRYWGVGDEEYVRRAGLWPIDPRGELVNLILIEDKVGIQDARRIVSTPGASIVIPGPGDLRRAYEGDLEGVENAIQATLAACKEYGVPCGITAGPEDVEKRLDEGFRVIIVTDHDALAVGRRAAGRS
jgi:4-hydroxy-2-oxoheptanedioate aldolase